MAKRKKVRRGLSKKKPPTLLELTRVKLLWGLSGVFTLAVAGLLLARPAPLTGATGAGAVLAARTQDPLDVAIAPDRGLDAGVWKRIVVARADSLGSASFHFAVLPQDSGDQLAISAEWSRQASFQGAPGELRVVLISPEVNQDPRDVRTITQLVERLTTRIGIASGAVSWK
jgi:hypothetical protein